jgi:DNA-binding MarR family transcriptional regulator
MRAVATKVRWLGPDEERAWRGWLRVGWLLDAVIARDLAEQDLSLADYYVLVQLSEAPQRRMRMSELAAGIAWSKSRVSHQVARMEARGLVRRTDCPGDARGTFAELRAAGLKAITAAAPSHVASIRRHFVDRLTRDQLHTLAEIAAHLVPALEADRSAGSGTIEG